MIFETASKIGIVRDQGHGGRTERWLRPGDVSREKDCRD
jgi:hypothetical protein